MIKHPRGEGVGVTAGTGSRGVQQKELGQQIETGKRRHPLSWGLGFLSALALGILRCFMSVMVQSPPAHQAPRAALPQGSAVTCNPYSSCSAAPPKSSVSKASPPNSSQTAALGPAKPAAGPGRLELPTLNPEGAPCNWAPFSAGPHTQFETRASLPPSQHRAALRSLDEVC